MKQCGGVSIARDLPLSAVAELLYGYGRAHPGAIIDRVLVNDYEITFIMDNDYRVIDAAGTDRIEEDAK
jgi:hypothetical protein